MLFTPSRRQGGALPNPGRRKHHMDDDERVCERRGPATISSLLKVWALEEEEALRSRDSSWFFDLWKRVLPLFESAPSLEAADVIVPGIDLMNPHYPSFLAGCCSFDPGGADAFFDERLRRMTSLWSKIDMLLPSLSPRQRLLVFDLESDHAPCSALAHAQKQRYPGSDHRLVHISICMAAHNYRPGIDISFPAVLPAALGLASQREAPLAGRPLLFSFKGRRSHPLRERILALDNGADRVCRDCGSSRVEAQTRRPRLNVRAIPRAGKGGRVSGTARTHQCSPCRHRRHATTTTLTCWRPPASLSARAATRPTRSGWSRCAPPVLVELGGQPRKTTGELTPAGSLPPGPLVRRGACHLRRWVGSALLRGAHGPREYV